VLYIPKIYSYLIDREIDMFETKILAAFIQSRRDHDAAMHHVSDLSPMGTAVLSAIKEYYSMDAEASHVDADILKSRLDRKFGDVPKHARELDDYLTEIYAEDVSAINVANEILAAEKDRIGLLLADSILTKNKDAIAMYLKEYEEIHDEVVLEQDTEDTYTGAHLDEFEDMYNDEALIKVAPPALNAKLRGGLLRGMHLLLAAMPEAGKTLFAINMAAGFIRQGFRVLYVGNEDPIPELVLRLLSNLSGVAGEDLFDRKDYVMDKAVSLGYDLITFKGLDPGNIEAIDTLLRNGDYDVVVIDQLRNLTSKTENNTIRLEAVAQGARNLARRHDVLAVSVTQAAESARDKLVLNSGDIDGSNIGMPGACDVMVLVGMTDDYYLRDLRRVTLAKNKRGGVHDNFTVAIDRWHSRIRDYGGRS
jgi:archaellum biogenesis ATPase FlaH